MNGWNGGTTLFSPGTRTFEERSRRWTPPSRGDHLNLSRQGRWVLPRTEKWEGVYGLTRSTFCSPTPTRDPWTFDPVRALKEDSRSPSVTSRDSSHETRGKRNILSGNTPDTSPRRFPYPVLGPTFPDRARFGPHPSSVSTRPGTHCHPLGNPDRTPFSERSEK